jgi:hypothetical protein
MEVLQTLRACFRRFFRINDLAESCENSWPFVYDGCVAYVECAEDRDKKGHAIRSTTGRMGTLLRPSEQRS